MVLCCFFIVAPSAITVITQPNTKKDTIPKRKVNVAIYDKTRIREQLKEDEGFRQRAYWDRKQWTVGFGTKGTKGEVITREKAAERLDKHIEIAERDFDVLFKGHEEKFNEVRTEAFMNMLFNMGLGTMMEFKNTLGCIKGTKNPDWKKVAANLKQSLWYKQVGDRAERIVKEIETGEKV